MVSNDDYVLVVTINFETEYFQLFHIKILASKQLNTHVFFISKSYYYTTYKSDFES